MLRYRCRDEARARIDGIGIAENPCRATTRRVAVLLRRRQVLQLHSTPQLEPCLARLKIDAVHIVPGKVAAKVDGFLQASYSDHPSLLCWLDRTYEYNNIMSSQLATNIIPQATNAADYSEHFKIPFTIPAEKMQLHWLCNVSPLASKCASASTRR